MFRKSTFIMLLLSTLCFVTPAFATCIADHACVDASVSENPQVGIQEDESPAKTNLLSTDQIGEFEGVPTYSTSNCYTVLICNYRGCRRIIQCS